MSAREDKSGIFEGMLQGGFASGISTQAFEALEYTLRQSHGNVMFCSHLLSAMDTVYGQFFEDTNSRTISDPDLVKGLMKFARELVGRRVYESSIFRFKHNLRKIKQENATGIQKSDIHLSHDSLYGSGDSSDERRGRYENALREYESE